MRKNIIIVLMLLVLVVCVSCDAVVGGENTDKKSGATNGFLKGLDVYINFDNFYDSKSLSVINNIVATSFKYKAVCLSNSSAYGSKSEYANLDIVDGSAKITLVPGTWNITISGYNSDGGLVLLGEAREVELSALSNQVKINLLNADGLESSNVNFTLGAPAVQGGRIEVRYGKTLADIFSKTDADKVISDFESGFDAFQTREGFLKFADSLRIDSGTYVMQILYTDGNSKISGQILGFKAVEKTSVEITGNFDYGLYVKSGLDIELEPVMLDVEFSGTAPQYTVNVSPAEATELTYTWIINGSEVLSGQTEKTLSWTPTECGIYNITCIVSGKVGSDTLYGFAYGVYEKEE